MSDKGEVTEGFFSKFDYPYMIVVAAFMVTILVAISIQDSVTTTALATFNSTKELASEYVKTHQVVIVHGKEKDIITIERR